MRKYVVEICKIEFLCFLTLFLLCSSSNFSIKNLFSIWWFDLSESYILNWSFESSSSREFQNKSFILKLSHLFDKKFDRTFHRKSPRHGYFLPPTFVCILSDNYTGSRNRLANSISQVTSILL